MAYLRQTKVGLGSATFDLPPLQNSMLVALIGRRAASVAGATLPGWSFYIEEQDGTAGVDWFGWYTRIAGVAEPSLVNPNLSNSRVILYEVVGVATLPQARGAANTAAWQTLSVAPGTVPITAGAFVITGAIWNNGDADLTTATVSPGATIDFDGAGTDGTPGHRPHLLAAHWAVDPPVESPFITVSLDAAHLAGVFHMAFWPTVGPISSYPRGLSGAPEYVIELYDSSGTFGPNNKLGEIWDALTVGWSRFDRIPGKAFFSLPQSSRSLSSIVPLLTHVAIWRITPGADQLVYRGAVIDTDNTGDDVIVSCFDYKSLLSLSRAGFKTLYPTKAIGTEIITAEWTLAKGAASSPLGFVATGTIQDPLATDGVTVIKTNSQFGTLDQSRLQLFYDLTEMGRANTINQVTFDIDLTNTFVFLKNQNGTAATAFVLGGNISDYQYLPGWAKYRNDIATIGGASAGGSSEITSVNAAEVAAKGLRQDVTTLKTLIGIAGAATEVDQQKAALDRALRTLYQQQATLSLRVERGKVEPFVGYSMNDTVPIEISNGVDLITGSRRIVGTRAVFSEAGEDIDVYVSPIAS